MTDGPSIDDILLAINKSGYLMEQEVATHLEGRGLHVKTNVAFEDVDEKKSRELDVKAVQRVGYDDGAKIAAYVELLVECKNSTNPFVFIARPKNDWDRLQSPQEFVFPYRYSMKKELGSGRSTTRDVDAFHHLGFAQIYDAHVNSWKAVQFCRIDRKGKSWHANHGGLYDTIFYPMAKVLAARKQEIPRNHRPDEWRYFWLFFPLVVTSGDLFLIDSSMDVPSPVPVDHVSFVRELRSGHLSGSFTVTFVRQSALEGFLEKVVDPLAMLAKEIIEERKSQLKRVELPWID